MGRDKGVSIGNSDGFEVREHSERAVGPVVRDRVVVEIEADIRRFADLDVEPLMSRERVLG